MRKAILVGVSLAVVGWCTSASAQQAYRTGYAAGYAPRYAAPAQPAQRAGFAFTEAHIAYIRRALQLTPAQAQYWPPVEAALRNFAQRAQAARRGGFVQALSIASEVRRLVAIANPLIRSLSAGQKHEAMRVARTMGVSQMVAAF